MQTEYFSKPNKVKNVEKFKSQNENLALMLQGDPNQNLLLQMAIAP